MRIANFDFTHNRKEEGLRLMPRILTQTEKLTASCFHTWEFQANLFRCPGTAIPQNARAAGSWLNWVQSQGSEQDFLDTWTWMHRNQLADEKSAVQVASTSGSARPIEPRRRCGPTGWARAEATISSRSF